MLTEEHEYFLRFFLLLIQGGTEVLRCIADKALQKNNLTLRQFLSTNQNELLTTRALTQKQKDTLFPASPNGAEIDHFDISLLSYLITNFLNSCLDGNENKAVITIRQMRNDFTAHVPAAKMTCRTFNKEWIKLIRIFFTVCHGLPEEKRNKINDLIDSIENKGLDIVQEEINMIEKFNDSQQRIGEHIDTAVGKVRKDLDHLDTSVREVHKDLEHLDTSVSEVHEDLEHLDTSVSEVHKDLKHLGTSVSEVNKDLKHLGTSVSEVRNAPRGKLHLSADNPSTLSYGQIMLLQSWKDTITMSPSDEHKQVKEKIHNLMEDVKQISISVENVTEGSIILEFQCCSLMAVLSLTEYFNSSEFQVRLGEIAQALEDAVGGKINIEGTLDIQDVIKKAQQMEHEKVVQFGMACNCIDGLLDAFAIVKEHDLNSSTKSSTLQQESIGKPVTLQTSIDIGQIQQAIKSIKEFLDINLTKDANSKLSTIISNPTETRVSEPHCHIGGEYNTEDDDAENKLKTQNTITSDMKELEDGSSLHVSLVKTSDQTAENSEITTGRSETLGRGSDELCEYLCSTCAKDKKRKAVKYCLDCDKNLCSRCIDLHNSETNHRITAFLSCEMGEDSPGLPKHECEKHAGKLINVYCSGHDVVGCVVCVAINHSSCQGMYYILDIATKSDLDQKVNELEIKMSQLLALLDQMKHRKQDQIKQFQIEKDSLMRQIEKLLMKINNKLDEMAKTLANDTDSKNRIKEQAVMQSIETIDSVKSSLETNYKYLQDAKSINKVELFVRFKLANLKILELEHLLEPLTAETDVQSMKMVPSKDIRKFITSEDESLGRISEICVPKFTEHVADFNLRLETDKLTCLIYDACLSRSGHVFLCDINNECIKKLDHSYAVTEHLYLPGKPGMLCEIDSTMIAVTLYDLKNVQFVFQEPLTLGMSFSVGDLCRGIECYDAQLYVCCGGFKGENEGPGHIEVYTLNDELLRTYYEGFKLPCYIKVLGRNEFLISEFGEQNLKYADISAHQVSEMKIKALSVPQGSCRIGDSQLFIAGWLSNNIVLISQDGEQQQVLLTKDDGIVQPSAVCFNKTRSHLIVPISGSNVVKVFRVVI